MSAKRHCERCHVEIPAERLEILPDTRVCVECSRKIGGEFELTAVPGNLGKSGSLKKNYGDWQLRRKRKPIVPEEDE